ncbi:ammonium transporter [Persicimonas caeni]|uniref:Ammonium transporter n=1 Tax=Persicimonas caeni TaxID=2292766 RepID=A0A4Y6PQ17_PERCE|nr:ammonium transporter [Persicimonas caeni]QDG50370.1 ammonium transporter [Persicimonas caeni]QED31591.1 ammonium transporter [Persicimonas caeni]
MNLLNKPTATRRLFALIGFLALLAVPGAAFAADGQSQALTSDDVLFYVNNTWMLVATILVFIMHMGFSALESGFTRAKNTVNILFKNVGILAIGILTYALVGFSLMYPGAEAAGGVFGFAGFGVDPGAEGLTAAYNPGYTYWTDFIFQAMFAATAATIVSGAVAERIKLKPFLLFSALYVAVVYPIVGMWHWGGGWLAELGFYDFAGSTIVHSVGGWAAVAGVMVLGPRLGKYTDDKINDIKGHNLPLAALGVFLLWFGWFGFNGGSVLSADPAAVSTVFVTTSFAAAAGIAGAMVTSWIVQDKPDLGMVLNGALAGLVGITAGADVISAFDSIIVGGVSGVMVVLAVLGIDRIKLDDPVGAIAVHLVCGIWGTLAVGIFAPGQAFLPQLIGVAATAAFCFSTSFALFTAIKAVMGLRVDEQEELEGLDIGEHGMEAYAGFQFEPQPALEVPRRPVHEPQPALAPLGTTAQAPAGE